MDLRKKRTILKSLKREVKTLSSRIHKLCNEQNELKEKLAIEKAKANGSLQDEKEELGERIDTLYQERDDISGKIAHIEIEHMIEGLICQKDFLCHRSNYEELCCAGFLHKTKTLKCLEKEPSTCSFSLFNKDFHICECPVRKYIAENMGK